MAEVFQCRVDKKLVAKARQVAKEIGTTPGEVVRLMFAQMVKRRAIPFPLTADSPEDVILGPTKRRATPGRIVKRGKLKVWTGAVPATLIEEALEQSRHYTR